MALTTRPHVHENHRVDGFGCSGVGDFSGRVWRGCFPMVIAVAAMLLTACDGDVTDTTSAPLTPEVTVSDAASNPDTTTTTTSLPPLVSMIQVLGGSLPDNTSTADEVAVTRPDHPEMSYMTAVTVEDSALIAGGVMYPANAETTDAAVWTSPDGMTWDLLEDESGVFGDAVSATGESSDQVISDVAGGPLGVLAVGSDGLLFEHDAAVWLSIDGSVWNRMADDADVLGGEGDQFMHSVIQTPELAVAVGESAGEAAAWVSKDGSLWERAEIHDDSAGTGAEPSTMNDVAVAGYTFVAVGSAGVDLSPAVWLSADGVTWDRLLDSMAGERSGFSPDESSMSPMAAVAASEHGLVAIGTKQLHDADPSQTALTTGGPIVWTSPDGYEWQLIESSFLKLSDQQETSRYSYLKRGSPVLLEDVAWDGDRVLAIGRYELEPSPNDIPSFVTLWTSADGGSTWQIAGETTLAPTGSPRGALAFTRSNDSLVLVGTDEAPAGKHPDYGWMTYAFTPGVWIADLSAG